MEPGSDIEDLALGWSPRRLLSGELAVRTLSAARIAVARLPASGGASSSGGGSFTLPLRVSLQKLQIGRIELATPVFGIAADFIAEGQARLPSLDRAEGMLSLRRLDEPGEYRLDAHQDAGGLHARLAIREQGDGLLAAAAGLAELGPMTADAALDGPPDALASRMTLRAGKLHAEADGTIRLDQQSGEMVLTVNEIAPLAALAGRRIARQHPPDAPRRAGGTGQTGATTHLDVGRHPGADRRAGEAAAAHRQGRQAARDGGSAWQRHRADAVLARPARRPSPARRAR